MLCSMLRTRGAKVSEEQILKFLKFIEIVCPWFPEEGTVNTKTWEKVGGKCRKRNNSNEQEKQPGSCPRYKRGKHWANMCRSKIDINGKPLQQLGNYKRGQPRPPQTIGAVSVCPPQDYQRPNREYRTYIEATPGSTGLDLSPTSRYVLTPEMEPQAIPMGYTGLCQETL